MTTELMSISANASRMKHQNFAAAVTVYTDALAGSYPFDRTNFLQKVSTSSQINALIINFPQIGALSSFHVLEWDNVLSSEIQFVPNAADHINNQLPGAPVTYVGSGSTTLIFMAAANQQWHIGFISLGFGGGLTDVRGSLNEDVEVSTVGSVATISIGQKSGVADNLVINNTPADVNPASGRTAYGSGAGSVLQGTGSTAIGFSAGENSQGIRSVAIGYNAATTSQGEEAIAIGFQAGLTNQSINAIAIGSNAAATQQGETSIAIGVDAARFANQSNGSIAIGYSAGRNNQSGGGCIAIGQSAGALGQTTGSVAIGDAAGLIQNNQGAVAIGLQAGPTLATMGLSSIAIGELASAFPGGVAGGNNSICIGGGCGSNTRPENFEICIGAACVAGQAVGGLNFGANMQAIQATATDGVGAATPTTTAGFIPLTWNGTAYRIPVYLP